MPNKSLYQEWLNENNPFIQLEDGFFYFEPKSPGAFTSENLRFIADALDRNNQEWQDKIKAEERRARLDEILNPLPLQESYESSNENQSERNN